MFLHQAGHAATEPRHQGTVINHVGFVVPNVAEAVAKWKRAGVAVAPGNRAAPIKPGS